MPRLGLLSTPALSISYQQWNCRTYTTDSPAVTKAFGFQLRVTSFGFLVVRAWTGPAPAIVDI